MVTDTLTEIVEKYAPEKPQVSEQRLKGIDAKLYELQTEGAFGIEKAAVERLRSTALGYYPKINLSFLEQTTGKNINGIEYPFPKFCPFRIDKDEMDIILNFECNSRHSNGAYSFGFKVVDPGEIDFQIPEPYNSLNPALQLPFVRALKVIAPGGEWHYNCSGWGNKNEVEQITWFKGRPSRYYENLFRIVGNKREIEQGHNISAELKLVTKLNCLVPTKTRNKINQFRRIFSAKNKNLAGIYFIAERKPENWDITEKSLNIQPEKDPLVIGFVPNNPQAYLIDKFDATPLEDYVSREFTT